MRQRVGDEIELPEGTWIEYGATFEQLIPAGKRLSVIVPVLVIIFGLLFMAFGSGKDAAIVFSGVPLTLTGGVLALWLRHSVLDLRRCRFQRRTSHNFTLAKRQVYRASAGYPSGNPPDA